VVGRALELLLRVSGYEGRFIMPLDASGSQVAWGRSSGGASYHTGVKPRAARGPDHDA
jgi:hypothetical protein